jgi:hypothetical protein
MMEAPQLSRLASEAVALSGSQKAALEHVAAYARSRRAAALSRQGEVLRMCDIAPEELEHAVANVKRYARVAMHFHPDRPTSHGDTVVHGLLRDGCYRSQFETRLSNGGLTAHPGGRRDDCEQALFGGAYHRPGVTPAERPKYGSLDLLRHAEGPSPRFGSCYLVLSSHVSERCTFTYMDSHDDPDERGTLEEFDDLLAALLRDAFHREFALGEPDMIPGRLVARLRDQLPMPRGQSANALAVRNLNHYIEAQVHGDVVLGNDVDALVADASFKGTQTEALFVEICARDGVELHWHPGFQLAVEDVPRTFRGPTMPSLAKRVGRRGVVNARAIGDAVRELHTNHEAWQDRGTHAEVLQELKLLWHVPVRFGEPVVPEGDGAC